ncbi:MAG: glutamyl-tRNA reductase [Acidimicrobiales bacterium]
MSVIVVGVEHDSASLELLERVAIGESTLPKALGRLRDRPNLSEVVILSTCLRTEVYAVVERFHEGVDDLREFLADVSGSSIDSLGDRLAIRFDDDVPAHLFSVAAGLDSAVLGESEVLGQVRRAWQRSLEEKASGPVLGALFRHGIEAGKRVRSETGIARGITSLSHGAVALAADRRVDGLTGANVVVLGAGEMGEGVARALDGHDPAGVVVVNRSSERSHSVVAGLSRSIAPRSRTAALDDLGALLASADVVFTTVGSSHPVVRRSELAGPASGRSPEDPLVVVDLGVPRNVEPDAADLPGLLLFDMDVLREAVTSALSGRRRELTAATQIVSDEVERYRVAARARDVAPLVAALRSGAEDLRQAEVDRRRAKRTELSEAQWDQVDAVTRTVVASLLHRPTVVLKETAGTPRGERLVESLRSLFDL